jgi:purine-binding chemotaxis protein CheW
MMENEIDNLLWVIVTLEKRLFALRVADVETMVMLPTISSIPDAPSYIRGVINLRGKVIPVFDLRLRLGITTLKEETDNLISLLMQREADHVNWVNELELSVKESREFKLQTNPHLCAFGKWYDSFKTDNLIVSTMLRKFDTPHQCIHAIANKILLLTNANNNAGALKLIEDTRSGDLAEMVRLFALLRAELQTSIREIAVVISSDVNTYAVIVDSVETVSHVSISADNDIRNIGIELSENGLITSVGKLEKSNELVLVLDAKGIFDSHPKLPVGI